MKMTLKQSAKFDFQKRVLNIFPNNLKTVLSAVNNRVAGIIDPATVVLTKLKTSTDKNKQVFVKESDPALAVALLKFVGYETDLVNGNIVFATQRAAA